MSVQESSEPPMKRARQSETQKPLKDPNAPKKPCSSSFTFFIQERSKVVENLTAELAEKPTRKQVSAGLAEAWRSIDPERKAKIEKKYSKAMLAYKDAMDVYKKSPGCKRYQEAQAEARSANDSKKRSESTAEVGPPVHAEEGLDNPSQEELAKHAERLPDHILMRELQRRLAAASSRSPGLTELADHTSSAASVASEVAGNGGAVGEDEGEPHKEVEATVLPLARDSGAAAQAELSCENSSGYQCWYQTSKSGKAKIKEEMGPVPKAVIRQEAIKRWLQMSEGKRGKWENAAVADVGS